ncbi:unnamed protein product [Ectocarpus sp. 6 AP-2014]
MHALLCSLDPGSNVSSDATFKIANRTIGSAKCATFLMGELGHIVGHALVPNEKWQTLLPLWCGLADRLKRLEKEGKLTTANSDLCCEGLDDPTRHPMPSLFPGMSRAPFCDTFHKNQILSTSVNTPHPLLAEFCRKVGKLMTLPHERDEFRVVMSYIESGWDVGKAVSQANSASNKKHIRTSCSSELIAGLEGIMDEFQKQSDEFERKGGKPFFRERRGAEASTREAFANVLSCARKGCFTSGRTVAEQYVEDKVGPQTGLPFYHNIEGTGKNEGMHSKLNTRVASKSPIFGEARTDREMSIFVHSHNCSIDIARGICVRDLFGVRFWVEQEVIELSGNIDGPTPEVTYGCLRYARQGLRTPRKSGLAKGRCLAVPITPGSRMERFKHVPTELALTCLPWTRRSWRKIAVAGRRETEYPELLYVAASSQGV